MSKQITWRLSSAAFLLAIFLLGSCASNTKTVRKCNGKRGIMTPMGPM